MLNNQNTLLKRSLILLTLWLPLSMAAQHSLQYTRLSAEDGLSNNSVQCILQDKGGIMWIGTNGGLNRYDGSSFIQYNILSRPSLSNSVITALMQDEKGFIWIGTENGLNILDPATNSIRQFVHQDAASSSIPLGPIRGIKKMKDGQTLVMSERWVTRFAGYDRFSAIDIDSLLVLRDMVLTDITEYNNDAVWISYLDKPTILAKKIIHSGRQYISNTLLQSPDTAKMYVDDNNTYWSISCDGVSRYNNEPGSFTPWLTNIYSPSVSNLHEHTCYTADADGNIWHGTERGGFVKYDLHNRKVTDYSWLISAVNATIVYCIYRDNNNNIWTGTDNGIIKISNRTTIFNNIPFIIKGKELKNIRCRRITTDRYGRLYAATENHGLIKKMQTTRGSDTTIALSSFGAVPVSDLPFQNSHQGIHLRGQYDIGYIYDMWYDNKDFIWMAGFGISRYNIQTDSLEIFLVEGDNKAVAESVNQFSICFDGRLFWTAGQHNLFTFDPQTRIMQPFTDNKGNMPFKNIPSWSLVIKGEWLWAGSSKGLYKVNTRTKEVIKLSIHPVLEYGINDILMENDSSCWISTAGGGIIYYNEHTGKVKQYTSREGLSNNTVCGMLRDDNSNLWISTYTGLSYFNRQLDQFTNFYAKDGLNTDEFNRKAFSRLPDGRMIFGGLNGYMIFDPATAFKRDRPVNILLTRFSKTNRDGEAIETVFGIDSLKKVVIEPGDRFFSFYFTLSDLYDPAANRYFYQLGGADDTWHSLGNQHFISFNGLAPGNYLLKIKGNAGKGTPSANEIAVTIVVKRVFYKTAWFITLIVLATAAIVYFMVQYRIRQVKKIQYLRTRIASDLHDDVGSSLVRITVLADAIKRDDIKESTSEQLGAIAGISRGAVSTMKDVIWSIDSRNDTMGGIIQYMHEHLHNMLAPANIDFELLHAGLNDNEKLDMNFRQNVYLTFKEAINNVVKHSGASRVEVELKKENRVFSMRISDDGKGLGEKKNGSGQGLYNMHLRATRLKASLDIIPGKGVTILLKVPVK